MLNHLRHLPPLVFEHRLTELTYFTTDICNMGCQHCFVHEALNLKMPHLSVAEMAQIAKGLSPMQRVHLGGGEPFTRADIAELAVTVSNGMNAGVVCIPTNGWFTDRIAAFIDHFGQNGKGPLRLHFSINSPRAEAMDEFTRLKGSFARWRRSIDLALDKARQYPQITIVALATYNEHNQHEFRELIDFLHEDVKVDDFSFQLVRTHGDYAPDLDLAKFRELNRYYFKRWNRQNPLLSAFRETTRERSADYFASPRFERRCTSGKIRVVMSPAGDIYPCEKLGYPNLQTMDKVWMGNVRDFDLDLRLLMASERAREVYAATVSAACHCDHNIDQSLRLLSNAGFRRDVASRVLART